jgi:hypothetical protein
MYFEVEHTLQIQHRTHIIWHENGDTTNFKITEHNTLMIHCIKLAQRLINTIKCYKSLSNYHCIAICISIQVQNKNVTNYK